MQIIDLYNQPRRKLKAIERLEKRIEFPEDRESLREFVRYLDVQGISTVRQVKYLTQLSTVSRALGVPFGKATREDWQDCFERLDARAYSPHTLQDFRILSKRYLNWLHKLPPRVYPESINWVTTNLSGLMRKKGGKRSKYESEDIITPEEFQQLLDAATDLRDRVMLTLLWHLALRVGELANLRPKDFTVAGSALRVSVTGTKNDYATAPIPLNDKTAQELVLEWIAKHPNKNKPDFQDSPLIVSVRSGKPLSYRALKKQLEFLHDKAGITKAPNPHLYRHSALTRLATLPGMNQTTLAQFARVAFNSKALAGYLKRGEAPLFNYFEETLGKPDQLMAELYEKAQELDAMANSDEVIAALKRKLWEERAPKLLAEFRLLTAKVEKIAPETFGTITTFSGRREWEPPKNAKDAVTPKRKPRAPLLKTENGK